MISANAVEAGPAAAPRPGGFWRALAWPFRALVAALITGRAAAPHRHTGLLRVRRVEWVLPVRTLDPAFALDLAAVVLLLPLLGGPAFWWNVAATLPLLLRTRSPLAAWRLSLIGLVFALTTPTTDQLFRSPYAALVFLPALLCLYAAVVRGTREITLGAWLVTVLVFVPATQGGIIAVLVVTAVALYAYNVQARRQTQTKLTVTEQSAAHDRAAVAVLEERSRIARELHDVVAHHMMLIAIQAEAAPLDHPQAPPEVKADFAKIRSTALEALTETRRILGVLRADDDPAETAPQPGLDRLDELVDNARAAGLTVTVTHAGAARPVPSAVGLSAYRIAQESLSNVLRHAPGADVRVHLEYVERPAALRLSVRNGPPPARPDGRTLELPTGAGHGLVGMRERAAMLGGEVIAAPSPEGGFAVLANLPLEEDT